jgi:hypothetical protein
VVDPAKDGKCRSKIFEGENDDFLSCKIVYARESNNWVAIKGGEFD